MSFFESDNFMKLVYIAIACAIVTFGYINKDEAIDLYKYTLQTIFKG